MAWVGAYPIQSPPCRNVPNIICQCPLHIVHNYTVQMCEAVKQTRGQWNTDKIQLKASVEEEVNVHKSEIEKKAFKVFKLKQLVSCLILTFSSQDKDRWVWFSTLNHRIYFLYWFYFVIITKMCTSYLTPKQVRYALSCSSTKRKLGKVVPFNQG